jgi:hypothetical protein
MSHVAFMPWVRIDFSVEALGCRLVPVNWSELQDDALASVLDCYCASNGRSLSSVAVLEVDGCRARELCIAESDDPRLSDSMQLVRLLDKEDIGKEDKVAAALIELVAHEPRWHLAIAEGTTRISSGRPHTRSLFEVWFRDFFQARGSYAHEGIARRGQQLWTTEEHLLMVSFVLPRLMLLRLQQWGYYTLTTTDRQELRAIDRVLCLPSLFAKRKGIFGEQWCWQDAFHVVTDTRDDGGEVDHVLPIVNTIDHSAFTVQVGLRERE